MAIYTHKPVEGGVDKNQVKTWLLLGAWLCVCTRVLGGGGLGLCTWAPRPPWTVSDIPEGEGAGARRLRLALAQSGVHRHSKKGVDPRLW